jgi:hypothetical protein
MVQSEVDALAAAAEEKQSVSSGFSCNAAAENGNSLSRTGLMDEIHQTGAFPSIMLPSETKTTCSDGSHVVAPAAAAADGISAEASVLQSTSEIGTAPIDEIGNEHVKHFFDNTLMSKNVLAVSVDDKDAGDCSSVLKGSEKIPVENQAKWLAAVLSSVQKVSHPDVRVDPERR